MKKTISINISGILFHIEEDGYDTLRKYLEAISKHFSSYKDNQEIISDIENRMAEIFLSNLKNNKQVITAENVDKLIEKMGTIEDFSVSEEELRETASEQETETSSEDYYKYVAPPDAEQRGYKKLMRLENKKNLRRRLCWLCKVFCHRPALGKIDCYPAAFQRQFEFQLRFL